MRCSGLRAKALAQLLPHPVGPAQRDAHLLRDLADLRAVCPFLRSAARRPKQKTGEVAGSWLRAWGSGRLLRDRWVLLVLTSTRSQLLAYHIAPKE